MKSIDIKNLDLIECEKASYRERNGHILTILTYHQ
jgi:hypothetical protein